jgi:hypothetical protein
MRRAFLLMAAVLALLGSACGSDDGDGDASADTAAAGPTTSTTVAKAPANTPEEAVDTLLRAWQNNDRVVALRIAHEEAVAVLFSRPYSATQSRGCDQPSQLGTDCVYRLTGGPASLRVHVIGDEATGWVVETAEFLE